MVSIQLTKERLRDLQLQILQHNGGNIIDALLTSVLCNDLQRCWCVL